MRFSDKMNEQIRYDFRGSFEGEFKITDYLKINSRIGANKFYSKRNNESSLTLKIVGSMQIPYELKVNSIKKKVVGRGIPVMLITV